MTHPVSISFRRLENGHDLPLPTRQSVGAAGADLTAAIAEDAPITIAPQARALVGCGFAMALPVGYEGQVRPRSGLALKQGITVLNTPGTIDADYRGEVKVILINLGDAPFVVRRGDRIAQLVVAPVTAFAFTEVDNLDETERGGGGFGSTGIGR